MQWEAIKEAKKRGCSKYNFWGIAEDENDITAIKTYIEANVEDLPLVREK